MLQIAYEASLTDADTQQLYDGLLSGDPPGQPRHYAPLTFSLRDPKSRLVGGIMAATVWTWLSIDALWVDLALRGQGYGRQLVEQCETIALTRGCTHARLDTFDFQARPFYERLGYQVYAELPDFPLGHAQLHLRKLLTSAS